MANRCEIAPMSKLVCCFIIAALSILSGIVELPSNFFVAGQDNGSFVYRSFDSADNSSFIPLGYVQYNTSDSSFALNYNTSVGPTCGKLFYEKEVKLRDMKAGTVASFSTTFTFEITADANSTIHGDGLAFTIVPNSSLKVGSPGETLCLWDTSYDLKPQFLAVEFDTFQNTDLSDPSDSHIGVDVNSMNSRNPRNLCVENQTVCNYLCNGGDFTAWIDYNATEQILEVRFANGTYPSAPKPVNSIIQVPNLDLNTVFTDGSENMYVGFSGSTGAASEVHNIKSWIFENSLGFVEPAPHARSWVPLILYLCGGFAAFLLLVVVSSLYLRRRRRRVNGKQGDSAFNDLLGPQMFTYKELSKATKNFGDSELLGSGGFGAVYKANLLSSGSLVAVKRCYKPNSKHGEEGFVAEATSISQIRHRNLVQLQGWCHENGQLLLVYDYMPNGSLDEWLFNKCQGEQEFDSSISKLLTWDQRYNILAGVAAALAYVHEDWKQCVLHRDIKSSNVMLDADFNAHLGDFGLACMIDHQKVEKTWTRMAGTIGYMAPEMYYTGKASKETDVYSFGVLVLEVVCGRRPVMDKDALDPEDLVLVNCVWRAHEAGTLLSVADPSLGQTNANDKIRQINDSRRDKSIIFIEESKFGGADVDSSIEPKLQADKSNFVLDVLRLGLLCCQLNPGARPSMRIINQVFQTGDFAGLPQLPATNLTVPSYAFGYSSSTNSESSVFTCSQEEQHLCSRRSDCKDQ